MLKVSSRDFQRNMGYYQDQALKDGVAITRYGRDHLVVIRAEQYYALRQRARKAMAVGELSEADIQRLQETQMSARHEYLNSEIDEQQA